MEASNEREAVKKFLLDWDPTVFDDADSGVIRCFPLDSGRMIYRYVPFDIKPGMRVGPPRLVSIDPDDINDIRFATKDEFYEYMASPLDEQGVLE